MNAADAIRYQTLGATVLYRREADESRAPSGLQAAVIVDHDGEGLVDVVALPGMYGLDEDRYHPRLYQGVKLCRRDEGLADSCFPKPPNIKLGQDVLFRATVGELLDTKLPPHIRGVLAGKVVAIIPNPPGSAFPISLSVMLFPPQGNVMVAHAVQPRPADTKEVNTCWVEP